MTGQHTEVLSPLNVAALWPQLRRLSTEVIATRPTDPLHLRAGLAATGVGNLPLMPRTTVIGLRDGLTYHGIVVCRQLAGGAAWEAVSLRIQRDKDDETVEALLQAAAGAAAERGGRTLFVRYADGIPYEDTFRKAGLIAYAREQLFAPPQDEEDEAAPGTPFRPAGRADRPGVFRLYCHAMPEVIRRNEAITQQEFRAVLDLRGCTSEYVLDNEVDGLDGWVGAGESEAHLMVLGPGSARSAVDLVRAILPASGTLVVCEHQESALHIASEAGFAPLGIRVLAARRLAALNPLKEALAVPATPRVPN